MRMELLIVNDGSRRINKGQTFRPGTPPGRKLPRQFAASIGLTSGKPVDMLFDVIK